MLFIPYFIGVIISTVVFMAIFWYLTDEDTFSPYDHFMGMAASFLVSTVWFMVWPVLIVIGVLYLITIPLAKLVLKFKNRKVK